MSDKKIRELLVNATSIAIIGAKDKPGQAVDNVGRYLISTGYKIYPVHPKRHGIWGLETFTELAGLPETPDIVVLFRAAEYCPAHAREVLALPKKPKLFWMQLGISSPEAAQLMQDNNIEAVQNACIMVEHKRLLGSDA